MKTLLLAIAAIFLLQINAGAEKVRRHYKRHHHSHKPTYYYNNDDRTLSTHRQDNSVHADDRRRSPYKGDKVLENDGVKKNKQRNLNYNSGQALPANNGR